MDTPPFPPATVNISANFSQVAMTTTRFPSPSLSINKANRSEYNVTITTSGILFFKLSKFLVVASSSSGHLRIRRDWINATE